MKNHINIYNNLIKLTRDKKLYLNAGSAETFSLRLIFFLIHFALFLRSYKKDNSKKILQEIYDYNFRQLEISIREIGYGDVSINKKMKDYLNLFHKIISDVDTWDEMDIKKKSIFFENIIGKDANQTFFIDYFDKYEIFLKKNTLNSFTKDILKMDN